MSDYESYHADPPCNEKLDKTGRCPKCGIIPDTQSIALKRKSPGDGNSGRHESLRDSCPQGRAGSNPVLGTKGGYYPCMMCGSLTDEERGSWNREPILFFCGQSCHVKWIKEQETRYRKCLNEYC